MTERGAYPDGREHPAWRQQGTGDWLDARAATSLVGSDPLWTFRGLRSTRNRRERRRQHGAERRYEPPGGRLAG